MQNEVGYKLPLSLAIALHVFVFVALAHQKGQSMGQFNVTPVADSTEIVQAVTINQADVDAEISRIENEREQQRQAEIKRQAEQQRQADLAEKKRQDAEREVQRLQQQMKKEQQAQQQQAQEALEKLKQQQQAEQQQLEKLKQQKEQESQQLTQIEEQRKQLAQEQAQREREAAEQAAREKEAEKQRELEQQQRAREERVRREREQQQRRQQQIQGQVNHYKNLIVQAISSNWIIPDNIDPTLSSQFEIRLDADGNILSVKLIRSSGDPALDRSAETAIYRSSPLPIPSDADAVKMFRVLNLTVRPEQVLGHTIN